MSSVTATSVVDADFVMRGVFSDVADGSAGTDTSCLSAAAAWMLPCRDATRARAVAADDDVRAPLDMRRRLARMRLCVLRVRVCVFV